MVTIRKFIIFTTNGAHTHTPTMTKKFIEVALKQRKRKAKNEEFTREIEMKERMKTIQYMWQCYCYDFIVSLTV